MSMKPARSAAILLAMSMAASSNAKAECDFTAVTAEMQQLMAADGISDSAVLIGSAQGIWFKQYNGGFGDATVIPLASASKLLAGIRVLQLADQGVVNLDAAVTDHLSGPDYPWSVDAQGITLRQMFSHTAGYGDDSANPALSDRGITLLESAQRIATNAQNSIPQNFTPAGSKFAYGGISMQIGGAVAQAASAMDWQRGWKEDIGEPMCINSIDWQGLGPTLNYHIGGGAQSSLEDYARVLSMIVADGVGNGTRILSPSAIDTLRQSQIGNAAIAYVPPGATGLDDYSFGAWIEPLPTSVSTDAPVIHSIGAFGYAPWVDFSNQTFGIIMVFAPNAGNGVGQLPSGYVSRVALEHIVQIVRNQLAGNADTCQTGLVFDAVFNEGFDTAPSVPRCPDLLATP